MKCMLCRNRVKDFATVARVDTFETSVVFRALCVFTIINMRKYNNREILRIIVKTKICVNIVISYLDSYIYADRMKTVNGVPIIYAIGIKK
jgi:hypothetical protein